MTRLLSGRTASHLIAALVLAFLVLPILAVLPASFNDASFIRLPPNRLSLRWYDAFFADASWLRALFTSLRVAVMATAFSVILGTLAALGLERTSPKLRALLTGLFLAPLIVPVIMIAIALYYVSRHIGLHGTTLGLALGHTLLCLPFVVINVGVSLRSLDPSLPRAAEGLGASPWHSFRTVTLPIILPGLLAGAAFAFITSFDEVVISIFLSSIQAKTLPVQMWETMRVEFTPVTAVASTLLILLTFAAFALVQAVRQRSGREIQR